MSVYRIYVEKKPEFAVEAQSVLNDLQTRSSAECYGGSDSEPL